MAAQSALVPVEFHGATIYAIVIDGVHFVALRPICDAIGIDWEAQRQRIKRNPVLAEGACVMQAPSAGGDQDTLALPLPMLNGWLFGVNPNRVRPELRNKLIQYQRECFDVLARHFLPAQRPANPAIDYTRISPADKQAIREAVAKRAGKNRVAYSAMYETLHRHFDVNSYHELPVDALTEALALVKSVSPAEWEVVDKAPPAPAVPPGHMLVDRKKLAAIWTDLGKLRSRIDAMGVLESDLPPSWWQANAITN